MTAQRKVRRAPRPYRDNAWQYLAAGHSPFALCPKTKFPPPSGVTGWDGEIVDAEGVEWFFSEYPRGSNIALRLPHGVVGVDVDWYKGPAEQAVWKRLCGEFGPLPDAPWCSSRDDGVSGTRLFRVPDDYVARSVLQFAGEKDRAGEIVQFHHRFVVAPPSVHPSGQIYRWILGGPFPAVDGLPRLPEPWMGGLGATERAGKGGGSPRVRNLRAGVWHRARLRSLRYLPTREIERKISARVAALAEMLPETGRNDELWELACRFGELVAADRVTEDDAYDELLAACDQNGLIADEGQWKVEDTIGRGLERGAEG